jgi:hypothetical protein
MLGRNIVIVLTTVCGAVLAAYGITDLWPRPGVSELANAAGIFLCAAVYARVTRPPR